MDDENFSSPKLSSHLLPFSELSAIFRYQLRRGRLLLLYNVLHRNNPSCTAALILLLLIRHRMMFAVRRDRAPLGRERLHLSNLFLFLSTSPNSKSFFLESPLLCAKHRREERTRECECTVTDVVSTQTRCSISWVGLRGESSLWYLSFAKARVRIECGQHLMMTTQLICGFQKYLFLISCCRARACVTAR